MICNLPNFVFASDWATFMFDVKLSLNSTVIDIFALMLKYLDPTISRQIVLFDSKFLLNSASWLLVLTKRRYISKGIWSDSKYPVWTFPLAKKISCLIITIIYSNFVRTQY